MQDEELGYDADAADHGAGQQSGVENHEDQLEEQVRVSSSENGDGEASGGEIVRNPRSQELIRAADTLVAASEDELRVAGLGAIIGAAYSYQWSGMLPSPDEFNKYDEETRERICRWNDSFTVEESARQDKLVESEIKQQEQGAAMTFVLMCFFGVASLIAFLATGNVASFGFLSVPVINILGNLFRPVFSKSSRGDTK